MDHKENILICDDHPVCCVGLKTSLAQIPSQKLRSFHMAYTGGDALSLAKTVNFDYVFMDLKLPDMSGVRAIEAMASSLKGKKVVVYTSAHEFPMLSSLYKKFKSLPVAAVLSKSFSQEKLYMVLKHIDAGAENIYFDDVMQKLMGEVSQDIFFDPKFHRE